MHLVSCATPHEPLEDAPRTALLADRPDGERWDGFWSSMSDAYYVRRTLPDGATEWYQVADEVIPSRTRAQVRADALAEPRVLTLRVQSRSQFVVAQSPNGQRMLVGNARRSPR